MGFRKGERWKKLVDIPHERILDSDGFRHALQAVNMPIEYRSITVPSAVSLRNRATRFFVPYSRFGEASAILLEWRMAEFNKALQEQQ